MPNTPPLLPRPCRIEFNSIAVGQVLAVAPTIPFKLYAQVALREKIARDMDAQGMTLDVVTSLPRKPEAKQ
jgi:hypothetical protein